MKSGYRSAGVLALLSLAASAFAEDEFSWIRGTNYVPSYAATDVVLWHEYDHETIDRELGYAESIGLTGCSSQVPHKRLIRKSQVNLNMIQLQSLESFNLPLREVVDFAGHLHAEQRQR